MLAAWRLWHSRKNWERFAREDPLWAVLTDAGKQGGRWDPQEFFRTGELDLAGDLARMAQLWPDLRRGRALDFGCAVGRLTQALAGHFDAVTGVDIAADMLETARRYDRSGGKVRYVLNTTADLAQFADGSFDFVYSLITLQHVPPPHGEGYLREFTRVLAPGGALLFQVPSRFRGQPRSPWGPRALARRAQRALLLAPTMGMYPIPREEVLALLAAGGVAVSQVMPSDNCGAEYESFRYYARKPPTDGDSAAAGQ